MEHLVTRDRRWFDIGPLTYVGLGVILLAPILGCTPQRFAALDLEALPTAEDYPEDGEIVLFDENVLRYALVDGSPTVEYSRHLRYRVLSLAGILDGTYGDGMSVDYEPGKVDLLDFEARVLALSHRRCADDGAPHHCKDVEPGRGRLYGRADADEYSRLSKSVETDEMILSFREEHLQVGSVVEVFHRTRQRDAHLRGHHIRMTGYQPTLVRRIVLDMPSDWTVDAVPRQRGRKLPNWTPEVSVEGDRRREVWALNDVPPVVREPYDAYLWDLAPTLFVRLRSWRDDDGVLHEPIPDRKAIGAFFAREIAARDLGEITDDIRTQAEVIVAGTTDPRERARRLHDWVRWRIRHTVVAAELDGLLPDRAADVLERRHGRWPSIALLLKTMLAAVGIESDLVYLYRHSLLRRWPDPATILQGADGIGVQVRLPEGPVWAFPGERTVPFGRIPAHLQFARAIRCTELGDDFALEGDPAHGGLQHVELDLRVTPSGSVDGTFRSTLSGLFADGARDVLAGAGRRSQRLRLPWLLDFDGEVHRITALESLDADTPDAPVIAEGEFTLGERIETEGGGVWAINPSDIVDGHAPDLLPSPRFSPVVFGNPRQYTERIRLTVPDGWRLEVPPERTVKSPFGSFEIGYAVHGSTLTIHRDTLLARTELHPQQYADYVEYLAEVRRLDARPILLHRSAP